MKTLKKLHTVLAILAICLCFTACSSDDDNNNGGNSDAASIVGSWEYEEEDYYEEITFKSNGTVIIYSEEYYDGEWEEWEEKGTYSVKGNKLTVDIDDEVTTCTFKISSKKLTIENEEGDTYVYYRVED